MRPVTADDSARPGSLLEILALGMAAEPDKAALVHLDGADDEDPDVWSYRRLLDTCTRAAAALRGIVAPGEAVAILAPTIPEHLAAIIAASTAAVAFPMNPLLAPEAIAAQLAVAGAGAVIVFGDHPAVDINTRTRLAIEQAQGVHHLVEIAATAASPRVGVEALTWDELLARGGDGVDAEPDPRRPAALFHTGGTSGAPKLAELSLQALTAGPCLSAQAVRWRRDDRVLNLLPYFHVGGTLSVALSVFSSGATVITCGLAGARTPGLMAAIWPLIERMGVTVPAFVPTSWTAAAAHLPLRRPPSVRGLCTGASTMPVDLAQRLETSLGVPLSQLFGMTEMAGMCAAQPIDGTFRAHAVGYPPEGIDIEVGDDGEIRIRGPNMFAGYRLAGGRRIEAEPVLATGDLGRRLPDGQIAILGRKKDVIIRGGHNIDPAAIEEVALQHPDVLDAAAVSMPDAYAGEVPVLFAVLRERHAPPDALLAAIAAGIADPPARPKALIEVPRLPLTPAGKIERYRLRQEAACRKAREALGDPPGLEVGCRDAAAKRLSLRFLVAPTATVMATIERQLAPLGLSLEA